MSLNAHLFRDLLFRKPSVELAPPLSLHRCLVHIWKRFRLRTRLFLMEGDALVLRDCVGDYRCCAEIGLRVDPGSAAPHPPRARHHEGGHPLEGC